MLRVALIHRGARRERIEFAGPWLRRAGGKGAGQWARTRAGRVRLAVGGPPRSGSGGPAEVGDRSAGRGGPGGSPGASKGLGGRQVEGRQAVRELLMAERRKVHEVWISAELEGDAGVADIVEIAAARRITLSRAPRAKLEREARSEAPQGVLAHAAEIPEADLADLIRRRAGRMPFLVAVDGVTDPGNLGAIIRSCDGAGVTACCCRDTVRCT